MCETNYKTIISQLATPQGEIVFTEYIPQAEEKTPCLIMNHGFNSCSEKLADIAKLIAAQGITVICYDFNGGGTKCKSSGKTTDMSVFTEQNDLREMIAYVKKTHSPDKLYLYGESQGGFVAALTAPEYSDIAGLFLVYPAFVIPYDWHEREEEELQGEIDFMGVKLSRAYYDGVPRYDVFAKAAEFSGTIKIWHGAADNIVDPKYSLKLVQTCKNCELTVVSELGHWFPPELRERIADEIASSITEQ